MQENGGDCQETQARTVAAMQELLATAIEMHQAGQLGPAAQLYQRVLARDESNAVALHLLGVLHHQQGDHAGRWS